MIQSVFNPYGLSFSIYLHFINIIIFRFPFPFSKLLNQPRTYRMDSVGQSDKPVTSAREEFKRQKQLEKARREGKLPPELDEHGQEISPYIPHYIAKAPWYASSGDNPSLRHQKSRNLYHPDQSSASHHEKITLDSSNSIKYQKGACENCGALTHNRRDCVERPRKVGAKWSGVISSEPIKEVIIKEAKLDFEGKRDRWAGYDPSTYQEEFLKEWSKVEDSHQRAKIQKSINKRLKSSKNKNEDDDNDSQDYSDDNIKGIDKESDKEEEEENDEEELYAEKTQVPEHKFPDPYTRVSAKNLRIREDTAKYLKDLNSNLFYNPKSRSMREQVNGSKAFSSKRKIERITKDNLSQVVKQITAAHNSPWTLASSEKKNLKELEKLSWESTPLPPPIEESENSKKLYSIVNPTFVEEGKKKLLSKELKEQQDRESILQELYGDESTSMRKGSLPDSVIH